MISTLLLVLVCFSTMTATKETSHHKTLEQGQGTSFSATSTHAMPASMSTGRMKTAEIQRVVAKNRPALISTAATPVTLPDLSETAATSITSAQAVTVTAVEPAVTEPTAVPAIADVSVAASEPMTTNTTTTSEKPISSGAATPLSEVDKKRADALRTAVALNFCRAAFHRIRKEPTAQVLKQEEEKILNNLNLTQVEDKEVITLYTSVLDEISSVAVTHEEKQLYEKHHKTTMQRKITWDALAFTTELATAQFGSAVRTGANSWWDYRNKTFQRDMDMLKIEKVEVSGLLKRSNQLLDTFWDMARKKEIPDRWLVRGDNLNELETAVAENDPETRLRILNRMKPFMEAYPPYWYYLSRTQQELGQLTEAIQTYSYLDKIGNGHFRKDDMLATAMANKAAIQDFLGDGQAVASAEKSLEYSTDVWEANLIASRILQRHGKLAMAEDAILRNLDVKLEESQSTIFLASLYFYSRDEEKLVKMLNDTVVVSHLPAPVLLRCAALIGAKRTPPHVMKSILASLSAYPKNQFGRDELTLRVGFAWQLHLASFEVKHQGRVLADPQVLTRNGYYDLRFAERLDWGSAIGGSMPDPEVELALTYPDDTVIHVNLRGKNTTLGRGPISISTPQTMQISGISIGEQTLALHIKEAMNFPDEPVTIEAARPISEQIPSLPAKPTVIEESIPRIFTGDQF